MEAIFQLYAMITLPLGKESPSALDMKVGGSYSRLGICEHRKNLCTVLRPCPKVSNPELHIA